MTNTQFVNTNGLDEEGHYSSARDVALMSRELLKHPKITDYTSIWTDELRGGKLQLANTNKLIRFYTGANGLKTGSTSEALCCLSASAVRDNMQLIAVVLGAPTSAVRFSSAKALLDYGFANYRVNHLISGGETVCDADIEGGIETAVSAAAANDVNLLQNKTDSKELEKRVYINEGIKAPIKKGDVIGSVDFALGDEVKASVPLCAVKDVGKKGVGGILYGLLIGFFA